MKRIIALAALCAVLVPATAHAASTVSVNTPAGLYAPVDVTVDAAATITVNTTALAPTGHWVASGPCRLTATVGYSGTPGRVNGAVCDGPGSVHFTTTGTITSTCPFDGGILRTTRLTVTINGSVAYDAELWPNPVVCYVSPAARAVTAWSPGVLTFTNSQARPSAATTFTLTDAAWNYSAHTFTAPPGVTCSTNLVDVNPSRWIISLAERGFKCSTVVPANTVLTVGVI